MTPYLRSRAVYALEDVNACTRYVNDVVRDGWNNDSSTDSDKDRKRKQEAGADPGTDLCSLRIVFDANILLRTTALRTRRFGSVRFQGMCSILG